MKSIAPSELIINDDGTIFHLHLRPEQLADTVILVGDPARVDMVASMFDDVEHTVKNREFRTVTGSYKSKRMSVISTGIGIGNIDICLSELDALANIDLLTREIKKDFRQLTLVRLGTSGALQADIELGEVVMAHTSIGIDGVLQYYAGSECVRDLDLEREFVEKTLWSDTLPRPYAVNSDKELVALFRDCTREGITIASPGFYSPQGRSLRLKPAFEGLNERIEAVSMQGGRKVTNYEMESSLLAGLARLMGHRAVTLCTIIAQRVASEMKVDYKKAVEAMVRLALDKLAQLK